MGTDKHIPDKVLREDARLFPPLLGLSKKLWLQNKAKPQVKMLLPSQGIEGEKLTTCPGDDHERGLEQH